MDCCNFMPYRHHQYYGSQNYYEAFPYPQEYYGHGYQDYYQPYYQQHQWQCSPTFTTDYVYNPKEARIRKAMRDASRERAMGLTPMPSPRGGIRRGVSGSNAWGFPGDDQMMMNTHAMRMMSSPMCSSPGFNAIQNPPNGAFMPPLHYGKHMHPMPHHANPPFVQNNSVPARIPQQDLWQPYEEIRSNSTGPYIIPPHASHQQINNYHQFDSVRAKPKLEPPEVFQPESSLQRREDHMEKMPIFENKLDNIQPLQHQQQQHAENEHYEAGFSEEEPKPKTPKVKPPAATVTTAAEAEGFEPSRKPLPDFNEAFGSTERGRFQRPPNNKGFLDYLENDVKFLDYQL